MWENINIDSGKAPERIVTKPPYPTPRSIPVHLENDFIIIHQVPGILNEDETGPPSLADASYGEILDL